jgi:hypothetical protein
MKKFQVIICAFCLLMINPVIQAQELVTDILKKMEQGMKGDAMYAELSM